MRAISCIIFSARYLWGLLLSLFFQQPLSSEPWAKRAIGTTEKVNDASSRAADIGITQIETPIPAVRQVYPAIGGKVAA